jgi:hypothetical protein
MPTETRADQSDRRPQNESPLCKGKWRSTSRYRSELRAKERMNVYPSRHQLLLVRQVDIQAGGSPRPPRLQHAAGSAETALF